MLASRLARVVYAWAKFWYCIVCTTLAMIDRIHRRNDNEEMEISAIPALFVDSAGSCGAGATRMILLGTVADGVLEAMPCDVLVARVPGDFRRP